jgi:hypothetical protein
MGGPTVVRMNNKKVIKKSGMITHGDLDSYAMHSSQLRGTDFQITVDGRSQAHADYFRGFTRTGRLGLVAPQRIDGAGAVNLIMAHVTAFYDDYRAAGEPFRAYPDFFAFQETTPLADYGMYDIFPQHKLVEVDPDATDADGARDASAKLCALTDRGVQILLVPDRVKPDRTFHEIALASARRCIGSCYAYTFSGQVADADVEIHCARAPMLIDWTKEVFDSVGSDRDAEPRADEWLAAARGRERLEQSYRRITLDEALARL